MHPDYTCYTVVGEFQGTQIWEHRVVSRDRCFALVISYSPDAKRITPPIFHETAPESTGDTYDDCDVVTQPCSASLSLLDVFELGAMNQDHSGDIDPGVKFWTLMIRRLDSYQKGRHERDRKQGVDGSVQESSEGASSDPTIEAEQVGQGPFDRPGWNDLSEESGPANGNDGCGERPNGTTRAVH